MITAEEMRRLLRDQFGITTDAELDKRIEGEGGIRIAIFVDQKAMICSDMVEAK